MQIKELEAQARRMRYLALKAITCAGSGHPGGSLSLADIMTALYFDAANINPQDPHDPLRDRIVLSKGHACPILYAALCMKGFITEDELFSLRRTDSFLQGHPDMKHTPGVDMTTGSLGQGISAACGMALAAKLQKQNFHVYAILGDGEMDEGQVWEALMFASQYKLDNLTVLVDHNGLQIDGSNDEVMKLPRLTESMDALRLNSMTINGNDMQEVCAALASAKAHHGAATVIIANTIKGKGVSFMENQVGWHGKAPSQEELQQAARELLAEE